MLKGKLEPSSVPANEGPVKMEVLPCDRTPRGSNRTEQICVSNVETSARQIYEKIAKYSRLFKKISIHIFVYI